jgi:hypothetical protein
VCLGDGHTRGNPTSDVVWNVSYYDEVRFCQWDGDRKLPSEALWEKAARGPAPRHNKYLWGDTSTCNPLLFNGCPPPLGGLAPSPGAIDPAGFYGAGPMGAFYMEHVRDPYDVEFYMKPESVTMPEDSQVNGGFDHVVRGYTTHFLMHQPISLRDADDDPGVSNSNRVFRCSRRVADAP